MKNSRFQTLISGAAIALMLIAIPAGEALAETITVKVNGLVCDFCARAIEKTFLKHDAVKHVAINLETKIVTIHTQDGQTIDDETIARLVKNAGYSLEAIERD